MCAQSPLAPHCPTLARPCCHRGARQGGRCAGWAGRLVPLLPAGGVPGRQGQERSGSAGALVSNQVGTTSLAISHALHNCIPWHNSHALQCTKLEPLHAFEGKKHSCRASLLKRHHRHRQQRGRAGGSSAQQRSSSSSEGQLPEPSNSSMQRGSPLPMAMEHIAVQELPRGALAATIAALPDAAAGPQAPYHQAGDAAGPGASLATLLACQGEDQGSAHARPAPLWL